MKQNCKKGSITNHKHEIERVRLRKKLKFLRTKIEIAERKKRRQ